MAGGARRRLWLGRLIGRTVLAKSGALPEPSLRWQLRIEAAARRAGVATPGLIETHAGALSSGGWTLEPWIDGRPATRADLAALPLRRIHAEARSLPNRPGLSARMPPNWDRLAEIGGPEGGIHGDLHPGNLLIAGDGRPVLLDWEEARRGPLAIDGAEPGSVTHLAAELRACVVAEPARAGRMARGLLRHRPRRGVAARRPGGAA